MKKFINNKLLLVFGLILTVLLISGGTFAYFQWQSSLEDKTNVIVSVTDDIKMTINPAAVTKTGMRPTNNCGGEFGMSGTSVVTIDNQTGVLARPRFKLKLKITDIDGNNITNEDSPMGAPYRQYIKYAVAETDGNCTSPLSSGNFSLDTETSLGSGWYESSTLTLNDSDGFPALSDGKNSGVSFNAAANTVTNHTYKVWIWIDNNYTAISTGDSVTVDKLQNATITVSWSENSTVEQVSGDGAVEIVRPAGEAYAVYSADDTSLRFYRSETPIEEGSTYNGLTATAVYTGFEDDDEDNWYWWDYAGTITAVIFEAEIVPTNTSWWFESFSSVENFDLAKLNTSYVTNMSGMFWNIGTKGKTLSLDLRSFDTSNVEYMNEMFSGLWYDKITLNVSDWDTSNVTEMFGMFSVYDDDGLYQALEIVGIETWNVSNVTNMSEMFVNCWNNIENLSLDLSNWDVSSVTDMGLMFSGVGANMTGDLTIDLSGWDLRNTDVNNMLNNVGENASNINLNLSGWKISKKNNINAIASLSNIYFPGDNVKNSWKLNVSYWDLTDITDMSNMFFSVGSNAETFNIIGLNTWNVSNVSDMSNMFQYAGQNATTWSIGDLAGWKVLNVTDMSSMFYGAGEDATTFSLDLTGWNVSKVTDMSSMFSSAGFNSTSFIITGLNTWNTSSVTNMKNMFQLTGTYGTTWSIGDLSEWNTSAVTDMSHMFGSAGSSATTFSIIGLQSWDTSNVTNMDSMFNSFGKNANYSLNLSGWNVCNVTSYTYFNRQVTTKITAPNWGMECPST